MSSSSHKAEIAADRQTLASQPSSIGVDWMAVALSQMEAPLPRAASSQAIGMINGLVSFPTALIGVGYDYYIRLIIIIILLR